MTTDYNVANFLTEKARLLPDKTSTILPDGRSITFSALEQETSRMAKIFSDAGISKKMRVAMFVRPGFDFVPSIFALFRLGAVPVFIDPGMKLKNILACLREVQPEAMAGIPVAHVLSRVFTDSFSSIKIRIVLGKSLGKTLARFFPGTVYCASVAAGIETRAKDQTESQTHPSLAMQKNSPAAIIFTSGSTGIPKGVEISHGIFFGQAQVLRQQYNIGPDEIDLVVFPLFALFAAAWGITAVIADMNAAKPSEASGEKLADLINNHGVTHTAGSPAIWKKLLDHCASSDCKLPTLKRILMAGAPVPEGILISAKKVLENSADVFTPYGATEALPLTSISGQELLADCLSQTRKGRGTCVGRVLDDVELKIIEIRDDAIEIWQDVKVLPQGSVGEVVVKGPLVTRSYFNRPESNKLTKISHPNSDLNSDEEPGFWHRMGDLGYIDADGRLWFCGRKDHRFSTEVGEIYPVQLEGIFNHHPEVPRTAIVGVATTGSSSKKKSVLIVNAAEKNELRKDLTEMAAENGLPEFSSILFKSKFPLDVRHNIKINRPLLAEYASAKIPEPR